MNQATEPAHSPVEPAAKPSSPAVRNHPLEGAEIHSVFMGVYPFCVRIIED